MHVVDVCMRVCVYTHARMYTNKHENVEVNKYAAV